MPRLSSLRITPLRLIRSRWLRPFASHLLKRNLWRATPHAIGLGAALGFFFGILIPVGQIFFAVLAAIVLRANLLAAASTTLITNPLTFPPIYYFAWQTGKLIKSWLPGAVMSEAEHLAEESHLVAEGLMASMGAASGELFLGLITLAPLAAAIGYLLGWGLARLRERKQQGSK